MMSMDLQVAHHIPSLNDMEKLLRRDVPAVAYQLLEAKRKESLRWLEQAVLNVGNGC